MAKISGKQKYKIKGVIYENLYEVAKHYKISPSKAAYMVKNLRKDPDGNIIRIITLPLK